MSQAEKETVSVLRAAIGKKYVLTDQQSLEFYSMDVYRSFEIPIAVVQPSRTIFHRRRSCFKNVSTRENDVVAEY